MGNFQFISTRNYMKKDPSSSDENQTMKGPSVSFYSGAAYKSSKVINHGLGYTPLYRVYYEPYRDGRVVEGFQDTAYFLPATPNDVRITPVAPTLLAWADEDNLYINLYYTDNTLAGDDFPIYWTIYKDFGLS